MRYDEFHCEMIPATPTARGVRKAFEFWERDLRRRTYAQGLAHPLPLA